MRYRQLGWSGLRVSQLMMGTTFAGIGPYLSERRPRRRPTAHQ
jgi:hypothetical protein